MKNKQFGNITKLQLQAINNSLKVYSIGGYLFSKKGREKCFSFEFAQDMSVEHFVCFLKCAAKYLKRVNKENAITDK